VAIYSIGRTTSQTATATAPHTLITTSTDRAAIMECGIFMTSAVAGNFQLGRPAAVGVTPTSPVTVLPEDPALPAGTITSALAWGTNPTAPTTPLRTMNIPATIGTGLIFTFPRGLIVAVSSNFCLYNNSGGAVGTANCYWVVDE
jgi:hypothetical protein